MTTERLAQSRLLQKLIYLCQNDTGNAKLATHENSNTNDTSNRHLTLGYIHKMDTNILGKLISVIMPVTMYYTMKTNLQRPLLLFYVFTATKRTIPTYIMHLVYFV